MVNLENSEISNPNFKGRLRVFAKAWGLGLFLTLLAILWLTLVATTWASLD